MNISRVESAVVVDSRDGHLRIQWKPVFIEEGVQVLGSGSHPMTETVEVRRILFPVQLHDGVLPHRVSRQLDDMGFRFAYSRGAVGVRRASCRRPARPAVWCNKRSMQKVSRKR